MTTTDNTNTNRVPTNGQVEGQIKEEKSKRTRKPTPSLAGLLGDTPLKAEPVSAGTQWKRNTTRQSAPRDREQKRLDQDAQRTYDQWVKVGSPTDPDKCPSVRYRVNPDALDALIAYTRRCVATGGPLPGKQVRYVREGVGEDGKAAIRVMYRDMPAKPAKPADK